VGVPLRRRHLRVAEEGSDQLQRLPGVHPGRGEGVPLMPISA
jgi:hypothetical protein